MSDLRTLDHAQQQLAAAHVDLVERVARRLFRNNHRLIDEFIGDGYVGLCVAARSFDPSRGCDFETYATYRISGAMSDGARACWGRDMKDAKGRRPARCVTGLTPGTVSLHARLAPHREEPTTWADVAASRAEPVETSDERYEAVAEHRATLPNRINFVLDESFGHGRSLAEIGRLLGVTESRVSQLRTKGLRRLQERMGVAVDRRGARERILAELAREPLTDSSGHAVVRLARRTQSRVDSCGDLVRELQAQGMVERERCATDLRRIATIRITDDGRRCLEALTGARAA